MEANHENNEIKSTTKIFTYVTRFAKTPHNDVFLEFQIFVPVSFMYLKLCSVAISMLYC